jgi:pimeloyl-ACP methyl ester carboxylesterase
MYVAMLQEMLDQPDRLDALRSLAVRTLVIVGEQDTPFLGPSRRMADAIPGARLAVIPDAGHSPQFEAPEAWAKELLAFLAEVPA